MEYEYIINPKGKEGWRAFNTVNGHNIWFIMQPQVILNAGEEDEMIFKNHQECIDLLDSNEEKRAEFAQLLANNANTAYMTFCNNNDLYYI
jgi:hypothetical protein